MVAEQGVVVGVDGSPQSLDAVAWAALDASHRGRPLNILYAFMWPSVYAPVAAPVPTPYEQGMQAVAAEIVAEAAARARAAAPGVRLTTAMQVEPAASALLRAAEHAGTVVVGSRGRGGFAGLLLGSVGVQLAAHAACPVVIVRRAERPAGAEAGRVVIGIDGSHDAERALRFAFEQASSRGTGLTAVLAYHWPKSNGPGDMLPVAFDPGALREDERRTLAEATCGWIEKYPDVDFRSTVVKGRPAAVLIALSAGAELLVVGSRGRGGFAGLMLGSVSQAAIHHAACPVAIVRSAAHR
ncbi:universal stress protein [Dactylosporangium sp. CA-233914]|uniref:universal stress protein n=1 Tax=Dactylosporangium sp. CA-233914 TaxID=3239934 RepID=UPI003D93BCE4